MDNSADACIHRALTGVTDDPRAFTQYAKSMGLDPLQAVAWAGALNSHHPMTLIEGGPGTGKTRLSIMIAISFAVRRRRVLLVDMAPDSCNQAKKEVNAHLDILLKMDRTLDTRLKILSLPHFQHSRHNARGGTDINALFDACHTVEVNEHAMEIDPWAHTVELYRKKSQDESLGPDLRKAAQQWLAMLETIKTYRLSKSSRDRKPDPQLCREFSDAAEAAIKEIMEDEALKFIIADRLSYLELYDSPFKPDILVLDNATSTTEQELKGLLGFEFKRTIFVGDRAGIRPSIKELECDRSTMPNLPPSIQTTATHFADFVESRSAPYFQLKVNYRGHHDNTFLPGLLGYEWSSSATKYTAEERNPYKVVMDFWQSDHGKIYRENRREPCFPPHLLRDQNGNRIRRLMFNVRGDNSAGSRSMVNHANANQIAEIVFKMLGHRPANTRGLQPLKADQITIVTSTDDQREAIQKSIQHRQKRHRFGKLGKLPAVRTMEEWEGCSNSIVILDITLAYQYESTSLCHFSDWHRMNIALTSCKDLIWMVGNLDLWRSELNILMMKAQTRNFAFFVIDLLDLGDVIDVPSTNAIPKTWHERNSNPSQLTNQRRSSRLPAKEQYWAQEAMAYKGDKEMQEKLENELVKQLKRDRDHAAELQTIFESGEGPGLDFFKVARPTMEERRLLEEQLKQRRAMIHRE